MTAKATIHTGRRKTSVARVSFSEGTGDIHINGSSLEDFFPRKTGQMIVLQPLKVLDKMADFDISVTVKGGGISGQAGAVRHGISRALVGYNEDFRSTLREHGFLTRDDRSVERKKVGLHKARKRPQYSKR